jgi:hypothetical protein
MVLLRSVLGQPNQDRSERTSGDQDSAIVLMGKLLIGSPTFVPELNNVFVANGVQVTMLDCGCFMCPVVYA